MTPATVVDHMPSVSVVIPARNESQVMTECLQRVLASTYPKLEIIVLDDASRDKTPSLIKAFASDGVRFVESRPIPHGWLGKNYALKQLAAEASGTYILFMDVDTRIQADTISQLVAYQQQHEASMISVIPQRTDGFSWGVLFAPLRYVWAMLFHDPAHPAVASSLWMVRRKDLQQVASDFETLKDDIQPESFLARHFAQDRTYHVIAGEESVGVTYTKTWYSQVKTSRRLLFPLVGGKALHALFVIIDMVIALAPLLIFLPLAWTGWTIWQSVFGILWLGYAILYAAILRLFWPRWWLMGMWFWDVLLVQEIVLMIQSVIGYTRGTITWKGRKVHLPQQLAAETKTSIRD